MTEHKPTADAAVLPAPAFDRDRLLAWLAQHDIPHVTHDHPAVFRVDEGHELKAAMPGATPQSGMTVTPCAAAFSLNPFC